MANRASGDLITAVIYNQDTFSPGDIKLSAVQAAPTGWLICDGSAVSRTTYAALFAAIGTTYGSGDGSTTFNLPDLCGRMPVGYAPSGGHPDVSALGANDGVAVAFRRPKHRHTPHSHTPSGGGNFQKWSAGGGSSLNTLGGSETPSEVGSTSATDGGSGVATDPLDGPAYLALNFLIKT